MNRSPQTPHAISSKKTYRSRMVVYSSSSEGSDDDRQSQRDRNVIELIDSSPERSPNLGKKDANKQIPAAPPPARCSDEEDSCSDDGAILTL
jgi:hypothetical protein